MPTHTKNDSGSGQVARWRGQDIRMDGLDEKKLNNGCVLLFTEGLGMTKTKTVAEIFKEMVEELKKTSGPYDKVNNPYSEVNNPYSEVNNSYSKYNNPYSSFNSPYATQEEKKRALKELIDKYL